jgi:hypothetical protein
MNLQADEKLFMGWFSGGVYYSLISVGQSLNKAALCLQGNYL